MPQEDEEIIKYRNKINDLDKQIEISELKRQIVIKERRAQRAKAEEDGQKHYWC